MRLVEITGITGYDEIKALGKDPKKDALFQILMNRGWKTGPALKGSYGRVFRHPDYDYVLKIFKGDPAYLAFFQYAIKNQDNPHLPKIRGKYFKIPGNDQMYGVRLENLRPYREHEFLKNVGFICWLYQQFKDPNVKDVLMDRNPEVFKKGMFGSTPNYVKIADKWSKKNTVLARTIKEVANISSDFFLDLNDENFMRRGDTMVITDPLKPQA